jgi:hypothetical protein
VPAKAPLAEPVQEDLGPLPVQDFLALVFWLIGTSSNRVNSTAICSAICRDVSQDLLRFVALFLNGAINH